MELLQRPSWNSFSRRNVSPGPRRLTCSVCLNLRLDEDRNLSEHDRGYVKISLFHLTESAALADCRYCYLVYNGVMSSGLALDLGECPIITVFARYDAPLYVSWHDSLCGRVTIELFTPFGTPKPYHELGFARNISLTPDTEAVFALAKNWVRECQRAHPQCRSPPNAPLPRRMIYVGDSTIRLVQGSDCRFPYVALSHCWGTDAVCTTQRSNLEDYLRGISWAALPKTFQDAVTVTRTLGFTYLWIDSLCIVQDDREDWEEESQKMGSIYEHSFLTIAAATASSDQQGFLSQESRSLSKAYRSRDLSSGGWWSEWPLEGIKIRQAHDPRTDKGQKPLTTRGWTLQERLLPRRLLTYSNSLMWECRQANWCECGATLLTDPFCGASDAFLWMERDTLAAVLSAESDKENAYQYWYRSIVSVYIGRHLTKESDRLPAISALADKFQIKLKDRYLAGLWKDDLLRGLAWEVTGASKAQAFQAPSWSWASLQGPASIYWRHDSMIDATITFQVLDVDCSARKENPTSQVTGGYVRLMAPSMPASMTLLGIPQGTKPNFELLSLIPEKCGEQSTFSQYDFVPDVPLEQGDSVDPNGEPYLTIQRSSCSPSDAREEASGHVLCLLLSDWAANLNRPRCRLFMVIGGSSQFPGAYERLGLLRTDNGDGQSCWFEDFPDEEIVIV